MSVSSARPITPTATFVNTTLELPLWTVLTVMKGTFSILPFNAKLAPILAVSAALTHRHATDAKLDSSSRVGTVSSAKTSSKAV